VRIFIVVAKNRPELYQYFVSAFEGIDNVEVTLDRRLGPNDPARAGSHPDRRTPRDVYDVLERQGFVIVRLPV
jgi:hypothetical protein